MQVVMELLRVGNPPAVWRPVWIETISRAIVEVSVDANGGFLVEIHVPEIQALI